MSAYTINGTYEDGGMYIILTPISAGRWHCGLYIGVSETYGMVYHATNMNANDRWVFEDRMTENVVASRNIVAALHISTDIQDNRLKSAHDILVGTPVLPNGGVDSKWGENFSCRVWMLEAVDRLREAGLVPGERARDIVEEAYRLAASSTANAVRDMQKSRALLEKSGWR